MTAGKKTESCSESDFLAAGKEERLILDHKDFDFSYGWNRKKEPEQLYEFSWKAFEQR